MKKDQYKTLNILMLNRYYFNEAIVIPANEDFNSLGSKFYNHSLFGNIILLNSNESSNNNLTETVSNYTGFEFKFDTVYAKIQEAYQE